jgi:nitrous oxidase accessory protein NosD
MKRASFVVFLGILLALVICAAPFGGVAKADDAFYIIGSNDSDCSDSSCDSKTIQGALDAANPGAILELEGTFDFGNDQFVSLKKNVTIIGKRGPDGEYLAIIKGGMNTFALGWDPSLGIAEFDEDCWLDSNPNTQRWPAQFVIKNLQFEEPTWGAITGAATTGATIKNNRFIDGLKVERCYSFFPELPDGASWAISFNTNYWEDSRWPIVGVPSDITGHILIANNYIDGKVRLDPNGFDPAHGFSSLVHGQSILTNGIEWPIIIESTGASATITNNELENVAPYGLFVADNSGAQVFKNNRIMMNPEDEYGNPIGFVWAGISLQNYGDWSNRAPVTIKNNYIYSRVPDFVYGILSGSKASTIKNNVMVLDQPQESLWNPYGDSAGIKILDESENTIVQGNTIEGSGQAGIVIEGYNEIWTAEDNVVENNNLSNFTPLDAIDIWCRAFGEPDCPTYPGSHYHLTEFTSNNSVIDKKWLDEMVLLDDTSEYNPYDPTTYNGDNNIQLGH